jgi:Glycosyltransferase family 87
MVNLKHQWNSKSLQWIFWLYVLIAVIASVQDLLHPLKVYFNTDGRLYTEYNNYVIFKNSFFHLVQGKNIYQWFPEDQWDLYKYSPFFSLCFAVFAYFPDFIGLTLWSLLNSLIVFFAISKLPGFSKEKKSWILLYCFIELLGSIQNTQSNGLMAGLIILAFVFLEDSNYILAAFCIVFSIYIKIFGVVAFALYLLYPNKLKMAGWTIFWMVFMAVVPAFVTGFSQLGELYKHWFDLLREDQQASQGISLVGIIDSWFNTYVSKSIITGLGVILFCVPFLRITQYKDPTFKVLALCSVLLWTIVFNHKAESPTFIISMCGIAIWYFCTERGRGDTILFILAFILTTLSVSDLFPLSVKEHFIKPYRIKGLMSIIIWLKIIYEMIFRNAQGKNHRLATVTRP